MTWPATNVMMLGKLSPSQYRIQNPSVVPSPRIDYMPINTTPIAGQNVIRQVVMNGVKGVKYGLYGLRGLGETEGAVMQTIVDDGGMPSTQLSTQTAVVDDQTRKVWAMFYVPLVLTSGAVSLYHGYKRNNSLGWGLAWWLMGSAFPIVTPTVALAQGYGKRKKGR